MPLEQRAKARLTTGLVLLLVLGAGMVLGVALDRQLEARDVAGVETRRPGRWPGPDPRSRGFDPRSRDSARDPSQVRDSSQRRPSLIVEQVGLSEEQRRLADSIFWHFRSQMRALHEEFDEAYSTRYREIMGESREAMLGILTAEQRIVYDSLLTEWERRRQEQQADSAQGEESRGSRGGGRWNMP